MPRTPSVAAASGLLLTALITGCASAGDTAANGTTPVSSPEMVDPQPTPTADPTNESVASAAAVPDCTNLLTTEEYAALDEQGLEHRPDAASYPPPAGANLVADGALECLWAASQGDNRVWIARLVEPDELWNARVAELAPSGWTAADGPIRGALIRYPQFDEELQPAIVHADGVTYYAEPGRALRSIAAIATLQ